MTGRGQTSIAAESSALERQTQELAEPREIVRRQSEQIERLLQQQQDRQESPATHPPSPPPPSPSPPQALIELHPLEPLRERFRKKHLAVFEGGIDPFDVKEWIKSIKNLFDFIQLNEREKVSCAKLYAEEGCKDLVRCC